MLVMMNIDDVLVRWLRYKLAGCCAVVLQSMFLCGCSLPVQQEGKMGGVYIQLTFIDTIINFGQGILAFFVLGLDPEAFLMPLRKRWVLPACLRLSFVYLVTSIGMHMYVH